jgi:hypothetical protein
MANWWGDQWIRRLTGRLFHDWRFLARTIQDSGQPGVGDLVCLQVIVPPLARAGVADVSAGRIRPLVEPLELVDQLLFAWIVAVRANQLDYVDLINTW